jgi:hypothetical protein
MRRTLIGACVGAICGILALTVAGAWGGYNHADEWNAAPAPPPAKAAIWTAFVFVAYYWWLAAGVGGFIGGLAAFGSWLVRPRRAAGFAPKQEGEHYR